MTFRAKLDALKQRLSQKKRPLAVSFSGGVDSALLLAVAARTLGPDGVLAVTARAVAFPETEFREAEELARRLGVRLLSVDFDIMATPGFAENSPERCYHCKKALMTALWEAARAQGATDLADGANADDAGDHRPGMRAAAELGVISPLRDAGLHKDEIRSLLRDLDIPLWDKPSAACLASRIPYGQAITREALERVERAERRLRELGFINVRVRLHSDVARVEVGPAERTRFGEPGMLDAVGEELRAMGFPYAALDFLGYRSGSMNEIL